MGVRARFTRIAGRSARADEGFTLIELLVVVVVIGILAAIAIPIYIGQARAAHKAAADSWVTEAAHMIYLYDLQYGTMPTTLAAANVPTPSSDLATQYFASTTSFCVSAYWTGAPSGGGFGPTDDTYKTVFIPSQNRQSLVPVNPESYCTGVGG